MEAWLPVVMSSVGGTPHPDRIPGLKRFGMFRLQAVPLAKILILNGLGSKISKTNELACLMMVGSGLGSNGSGSTSIVAIWVGNYANSIGKNILD